ncbi:ferritin-like metal-binding protein YciE [Ancylobacter sp. 3268]|uniref:YciE/YciF ferroxidase family protein n=1 Tax=Ancylobacter sp. 3268 TaxID=2817752 RepID=UPI00285B7566|nr:DUF892 family protein [Ancylobacter sp. 3268]MDR6952271.1 ferritin-like metal-binding protein YciE [Ancylobacter sp. 3268]
MGLLSRDIKSLNDLLVQGLGEALYAERRCARVLPTLNVKTSDIQLKGELNAVLAGSAACVGRVEAVFRLLDRSPKAAECPAIDGLFIGAEEINGEIDDPHVLDSAIAAALLDVGTYKTARYATLIGWLRQLGRKDAAELLQPNQAGCRRFVEALHMLTERRLNPRAGGRLEPAPRLAS